MSNVVALKQSGTDVACAQDVGLAPRVFSRLGAVQLLVIQGGMQAPDQINGPFIRDLVLRAPGYVKLVAAINFCQTSNPGILGCSRINGGSFIVTPVPPGTGGLATFFPTFRDNAIVWAHEFGHTAGLPHNPPGSGQFNNRFIMNASFGSDHDHLTQPECNAFFVAQPPEGEPELGGEVQEVSITEPPAGMPLSKFIRTTWVHGLPVSYAQEEYGAGDVPELLQVLEDPLAGDYARMNSAVVLGLVGDDRVSEALVRFADGVRDSIARSDDTSLMSAGRMTTHNGSMMALGYLAHRTRSRRAMDYLMDCSAGTDMSRWTRSASPAQMAVGPAIGLALSGRPESHAMLLAMKESSVRGDRSAPSADDIDVFLDLHRTIARDGLRRYYER